MVSVCCHKADLKKYTHTYTVRLEREPNIHTLTTLFRSLIRMIIDHFRGKQVCSRNRK